MADNKIVTNAELEKNIEQLKDSKDYGSALEKQIKRKWLSSNQAILEKLKILNEIAITLDFKDWSNACSQLIKEILGGENEK